MVTVFHQTQIISAFVCRIRGPFYALELDLVGSPQTFTHFLASDDTEVADLL